MAVWAYPCMVCGGSAEEFFIPVGALAEMPPDTRIVRIRLGNQWRCATVDRRRKLSVEQMLIREAVASNEADCPECKPVSEHVLASEGERPAERAGMSAGRTVQAAAIALQGTRMVVVLVPADLLDSPGEAEMAADALAPSFSGTPVVLMAQREDGTPLYHGDAALLPLLDGVPLEHMPWKVYPIR